jgi:hypothetical protein
MFNFGQFMAGKILAVIHSLNFSLKLFRGPTSPPGKHTTCVFWWLKGEEYAPDGRK